MPIYEYRCKQCGNEFEVIQKADDQEPPCPKCESKDIEKNLSVTHTGQGSCGAPRKSPFS
ncbi:MAG: zinc ribbon domain-containing protein [Syntrophorhabdaceae bacterium]|nr:zinc ribbon domain-containing protein [Syntrophorhabdaceae bacterium]